MGISYSNEIEQVRNDLEEQLSPEPMTADSQNPTQIINQNFQFFMAMNTPFAASDMEIAPLSEVDDGFNDLIMLRGNNGGRVRMTRLLTAMESGEYFT